jgi:hypothetical protein
MSSRRSSLGVFAYVAVAKEDSLKALEARLGESVHVDSLHLATSSEDQPAFPLLLAAQHTGGTYDQ